MACLSTRTETLAPAIGGSVGDQASQPSWMAKFKRVEPGVMDKAPDIETRLIAGDPAVAATPATANPADVDGVPVSDEDVDGVPVSDDDVDGVPVSDDIDGTLCLTATLRTIQPSLMRELQPQHRMRKRHLSPSS